MHCAIYVHSHEIICVEVSPASPRHFLERRLLFNLSHFNWHTRGIPPRFDDQEDDGSEDNEHIGAKESGEHVHLPPEDGTIGLEFPCHDMVLLSSAAAVRIAGRRCTYRGREFFDVGRTQLQHIDVAGGI